MAAASSASSFTASLKSLPRSYSLTSLSHPLPQFCRTELQHRSPLRLRHSYACRSPPNSQDPSNPKKLFPFLNPKPSHRQKQRFHVEASGNEARPDLQTAKVMAADAENFSDGMAASQPISALESAEISENVAENADKAEILERLEAAAVSEVPENLSKELLRWSAMTETLTLSSTFAGLFLMAPQIWTNAGYLLAGQVEGLRILSWVGFSTGFLGNMLLLSYFASKRELSATLVQAVGASSTSILLSQIYLAGYMPPPAFFAVAAFLVCGLLINGFEYFGALPRSVWNLWQDLIGVIGLAVLPQVICQTFFSSVETILPGVITALAGLAFVTALRMGKVSEELRGMWTKLSGWTATLLFMFMPVAQLQACFTKPESLAGIPVLSPVMGIIANGLMIPRALFTRDLMWFTGATWGALMMGWAVLLSMALNRVVTWPFFLTATGLVFGYLGGLLLKDSQAYGLSSPLDSVKSLVKGGD